MEFCSDAKLHDVDCRRVTKPQWAEVHVDLTPKYYSKIMNTYAKHIIPTLNRDVSVKNNAVVKGRTEYWKARKFRWRAIMKSGYFH